MKPDFIKESISLSSSGVGHPEYPFSEEYWSTHCGSSITLYFCGVVNIFMLDEEI